MPKPLYPNWRAIRKIANPFIRIALYTATGKELKALQRAFPRCFSENQKDLRVPASLICEKVGAISKQDGNDPADAASDRQRNWSFALEALGVPEDLNWSDDQDWDWEPIPEEVLGQLKDVEMRCGVTFTYMKELFVVTYYLDNSSPFVVGSKMKRENGPTLSAAHARFIDLES